MSLEDALKAREVPRVPPPGNHEGTEKHPQDQQRSPSSPGSPAIQQGCGSNNEWHASHPSLADAARAADMQPETLAALLSPEDHMDIAVGTLECEELAAFARSVVGRWKAGAILPDERVLYRQFISYERCQTDRNQEPTLEEEPHGER